MSSAIPEPRARQTSVDQVSELVTSVTAYARQETIEPVKGAARWVAFGTVASLCLGLAMILGSLGVLRLSQDVLGDTFGQAWSFLHYLISALFLSILVWITIGRIARPSLAKEN